MENKKQLVIVLPMSEPLQKLNEVLVGIADEEKIEISLVDDLKELTQFVGSASCLVVISNAKKCATFLQENRLLISKNSSKMILLAPKEIPAKTLVKFTKIGLTESIPETSPPKTLLYKVKLLLRSIKVSSFQNEELDKVVKSMLDTSPLGDMQNEIASENKLLTELTEESIESESLPIAKVTQSEITEAEEDKNLKSKSNYQPEAIDTNWKSSNKKTGYSLEFEKEKKEKNVQHDENKSEFDNYYRNKKSTSNIDIHFENANDKNAAFYTDESSEENEKSLKSKKNSFELDISPSKKTNDALEQEDESSNHYGLKNTGHDFQLNLEKTQKNKNTLTTENEDEDTRRERELKEFDLLLEEARKKNHQLTNDEEDQLQVNSKHQTQLEFSREKEEVDKKEYDNSELAKSKKNNQLNLISANEQALATELSDESESQKPKSRIGQLNLESALNEATKDQSEQIEENDRLRKQKNLNFDAAAEVNNDKKSNHLNLLTGEKSKAQGLEQVTDEELSNKSTQSNDFNLEDAAQAHRGDENHLEDGSDDQLDTEGDDKVYDKDNIHKKRKNTDLSFDLNEKNKDENQLESDEDNKSKRKQNELNIKLEKSDNLVSDSKVEKINTYFKSTNNSKKEQNWDNLFSSSQSFDLGNKKKNPQQSDSQNQNESRDSGEVIIDYRQLKKEFEAQSDRSEDGESFKRSTADEKNQPGLDDEDSFKVIEVDMKAFDFGITILNLIYQKDIKPIEILKIIAEELISRYKAYTVFYNYNRTENTHHENFNSFLNLSATLITDDIQNVWTQQKNNELFFSQIFSKSMTTWSCSEINNPTSAQNVWEDNELPSWAINELTNKKVELVYPYFDGIDRMGIALVIFPSGIRPKDEKAIEVTLEMARTIYLESYSKAVSGLNDNDDGQMTNSKSSENKVISLFSGLFKGKKTG